MCYYITFLLRRGCFTTTLRLYYEGVVLLRHHVTTTKGLFYYNIHFTFLLRMICLLIHVLLQLHVRYISTLIIIFVRIFLLLLSLGNSSKFRKPLGINKGVRLYMYFVFPRIHRSWLVSLFWKSYWRGLRRLVASYVSRCIPVKHWS